jgi:rhamnulokinase
MNLVFFVNKFFKPEFMNKKYFLAFDLGASSGRASLGTLKENRLELTEGHRFANQMQLINGHHFWNIFSLFNELKIGLKNCVKELGIQPESIGIDTWGVDFVHLNKEGFILSLPYAYRDSRTNTSMDDLFQIIPKEEPYHLSFLLSLRSFLPAFPKRKYPLQVVL